MTQQTRIVPERNDQVPKPVVISQLSGGDVDGLKLARNGDLEDDQGNVYRWADAGNPENPGYFARKQRPKTHSDGTIEQPWELVHSTDDMKNTRPRDDQGNVSSAIRNGSTVLMRTTKENAAKAPAANDKAVAKLAEGLLMGESKQSGDIAVVARVSQNGSANPEQMLGMK